MRQSAYWHPILPFLTAGLVVTAVIQAARTVEMERQLRERPTIAQVSDRIASAVAGKADGLRSDADIIGLRRDLKALRSDLAAETVMRGQQIAAERSWRRQADKRTSYESTAAVALMLREQDARATAEKRSSDRLAAIESLWLDHRCPSPSPMPPLPSKTMPEAGR